MTIEVDDVYAKKGEVVQLTASVSCLDDYEIMWGTLGTDNGAILDRSAGTYKTPTCDREICTYGGEIFAELIRPADIDVERGSGKVVVADCCVPDQPLSCTREERCDCEDPPPICEAEFYVAPSGECVAPGATVQFQIQTDLGGEQPEVEWSLSRLDGESAGEIDQGGLWIAPGDGARALIRATRVDDAEVWAEADMTVRRDCGAWRIFGSPGGTMRGTQIAVTLPRAVPDEDGVLNWVFVLSQESLNAMPTGTLVLLGHPGFDENCEGPTGQYSAMVGGARGMEGLFTADPISAEVLEIGPAGDPMEEPSLISGELVTAEGICTGLENPDPIGDAVPLGTIQDPEAPEICLEVFESPDFPAQAWGLCASRRALSA